jgi:hypothetical protein
MVQGEVACHRRTVADLVLAEGRRRGEEVELVEWPGGEAGETTLDAEGKLLASVRRGRASVPLGDGLPATSLHGLAWGSVLRLRCGGEEARAVAGPARFRSGAWELPVLETVAAGADDGAARQRAETLRQAFGLAGRRSSG